VALLLIAPSFVPTDPELDAGIVDRPLSLQDRYDYRRTLIELRDELGAETNLDKMLESVADRMTSYAEESVRSPCSMWARRPKRRRFRMRGCQRRKGASTVACRSRPELPVDRAPASRTCSSSALEICFRPLILQRLARLPCARR